MGDRSRTLQQHDVGSIRMLPGGDRRATGKALWEWVDSCSRITSVCMGVRVCE